MQSIPDTVAPYGRYAASGPRWPAAYLAACAAVVLLLTAIHSSAVTLDDAYITYRYAENLALHGQLTYNLSGPAQSFATTAPAYATLLAGLRLLGLDIPLVGGWLGIAAIIVAAAALADLLGHWSRRGGLLAGILLAAFPMSWLVLGMEGLPALALALLGLALTLRGRTTWAALALAAATLLRFDAAAAAAAWGIFLLVRHGATSGRAWRAMLAYGLAVVAVYGAMMLFLGVPLPGTLGSKQAQVALGITGFFSDTDYLGGLLLMARAYWAHSPAYLAIPGLAIVGLLLGLRGPKAGDPAQAGRPVRAGRPLQPVRSSVAPFALLALWTVLHLGLYVVLGVTPYVWYYLPVAPLLCALASAGIVGIAGLVNRPATRLTAAIGAALLLLALPGPAVTHALMAAHPGGTPPTEPQALADKALPGTQYPAYRATGEWLAANTPEDATVGVTEVGIMGYFSRRPMVDFLGLLDREVSQALARGDMSWAMYARQPDYVAFSELNPAYAYGVYEDAWFQAAYDPLQRIGAQGFWGGDLTVYARGVEPLPQGTIDALPRGAEPLAIRFGDGPSDAFELIGLTAPAGPWQGGQAADVTFYWRVQQVPERNFAMFVHLVDDAGRIVAGHDQPPLLAAQPTSEWQPGIIYADFHPIGLPPLPLAPATLTWEVGFYDPDTGERLPAFGPDGVELPGGQARFGERLLLEGAAPAVLGVDEPAPCRIAIRSYRVEGGAVRRGAETSLVVEVADVSCPVDLTVDLWDWNADRAVWAQTVRVTRAGEVAFTIAVAAGDPATWPGLRLSAASGDARLYWLDDAGHPLADTVKLTPLSLVGP